MKYIISLGILFSLITCQRVSEKDQLLKALELAENRIAILEANANIKNAKPQRVLTHTLYFNLKKSLAKEQTATFETGLRSLSKIPVAKGVKVGKTAKTEDKRLISDYDYVLTMYFENEEDLQSYSNDGFHMKVRADIAPMLEKAPIVYDSWLELGKV